MNRETANFLEAGPDHLAEAAWEILAGPHDLWGNPRTDMSPQQRQRQRLWLQAQTEMLESKSYEQWGR